MAAHAGEHFPEGVENTIHRSLNGFEIVIVDVGAEHLTLNGGMFAVGLNMDREITVMLGISEPVMLLESVDLRFTDRRNLTLISVKCGQTFRGRSVGANRSESVDQILGLRPFFCARFIDIRDAETFGEFEPKLRMIWRTGFFIDQIR